MHKFFCNLSNKWYPCLYELNDQSLASVSQSLSLNGKVKHLTTKAKH